MNAGQMAGDADAFDYIIVGSGAGGAPLAARLAQARKRVLVLEAGPNQGISPPLEPDNEVTRVPALHGVASEHESLAWRFFVDHYNRGEDGGLPPGVPPDPKWHTPNAAEGEDDSHAGIFYPRASGVGGCTIHNAMITIAGPDQDWDDLADYLGDQSWSAARMRSYFQRLERNEYLPAPPRVARSPFRQIRDYVKDSIRWVFGFDPDATSGRHGFSGWLHTSVTDISLGLGDKQLVQMLKAALWQAKASGLAGGWTLVRRFLKGQVWQSLDPNHFQTQSKSPEGVVLIPLAVHGKQTTIHQNRATPYVMRGRRSSPRELLLATLAGYPQYLEIRTDCLVTELLFDDHDPLRTVGVKYRAGKRLYRAHLKPSGDEGEENIVRVKQGGEVVLCGGAFNTPQLLMLSGIGDPKELNDASVRIQCRHPLPGVGRNLQDRYEVSVVSEMKRDFSLLDGATFKLPNDATHVDPHLRQWREEGEGLYASNGAVLGIFKRSLPELTQPDLFIFGIPLSFRGYEVGYSRTGDQHNFFTWVILKSHSRNRDGQVKLRSSDPRDTPRINFHYFNEISRRDEGQNDPDLLALVHGVRFVRGILSHVRRAVEVSPGRNEKSSQQIKNWIRGNAWGHHACGTCRMGPDGDSEAVLDSRFRVRGVKGLRVVDASIFPSIPGYFLVANIYMASEKAADVMLEDSVTEKRDLPVYPRAMRAIEAEALQKRREKVELLDAGAVDGSDHKKHAKPRVGHFSASSEESPSTTVASVKLAEPLKTADSWNDDVTGLALSGGGIRSATFCLGILQTLARGHLLRRIDFMSTASGGGYIGACLGRFYDRLRPAVRFSAGHGTPVSPADRVEQELVNPGSRLVDWLRKHGNYIAPQGGGDGRLNFAVFTRNLLSVHLVVGLAILAAFGVANAIRYGLFDRLLAGVGLTMSKGDLPIGHLIQALFGPFFSPWFVLVEFLLLFLVIPRMVGYWIVSQDKHESYKGVSLVLMMFVAGLLLWLGVEGGLRWEPLLIGLALLSSLIQVELAWHRGRRREEAVGSGGVETQRLRTRNYLTYDLGLALGLAGAALVFALIDTAGHGLQEWQLAGNITYARAFAMLGAAIATAMPAARLFVNFFVQRESDAPSTVRRILRRNLVAGLMAVVLFTLPLIFYSFASHATYRGGQDLQAGILVTLLVAALTLVLAFPQALSFVNRSSLAQTYAARLARAYLGASNPLRYRPEGMNVTEVIPGDDVASIRDYRPHEATGPLHIINLIVNQTVDFGSRLRFRDRQGENLAVSCLGMSVGERWHSAWADSSYARGGRTHKVPARLEPVGRDPGEVHPLIDQLERPADRVEMLSLRQWIGVSGAAMDPGRGSTTNLGTALLLGLVNLRTGHWWDSGISEAARFGYPELSFMRKLLYLVPRVFATQCLLLFEWIARYPGPWQRYWHLSDGGYFENTGAYELVRRRLPRIIVCDGSADPHYQFDSFAELVRKVRIDFSANIRSFTEEEIDLHVPDSMRPWIGTLDDLKPASNANHGYGTPKKRAALFRITYDGDLTGNTSGEKSVLLYFKAAMVADASTDVRQYHESHPEFPHEDTADQSFDEPQWESYRKIGEQISGPVFSGANADWFWKIPL